MIPRNFYKDARGAVSVMKKITDGTATPDEHKMLNAATEISIYKFLRNPLSAEKLHANGIVTEFAPRSMVNAKIAEFTGASNYTWTGGASPDVEKVAQFLQLPEIDTGWQEVFAMDDYRGTKASGMEIATRAGGPKFAIIPQGGELQVYDMTGVDTRYEFQNLGGSIGFHKSTFDDDKVIKVNNDLFGFAENRASDIADLHYALIAAAADTNATSFTTSDVLTISAAAGNILSDLKSAGVGAGLNSQFILYTALNSTMHARCLTAIATLGQAVAGSNKAIPYNVRVIPTLNSYISSTYLGYLCYAGSNTGKRMGVREDPVVTQFYDQRKNTLEFASWQRFQSVVYDANECRRIAAS
jgi:hypothetical protein